MLPDTYVLMDGRSLGSSLEPILRILYSKDFSGYSSEPIEHVQFHLSTDEVSIIVPTRYIDYFKDKFYTPPYKALRVETDDPGLEESGIIADITALFKRYNISILSVSTYRYNYIYIPCDESLTVSKMVSENKELLELEIMEEN